MSTRLPLNLFVIYAREDLQTLLDIKAHIRPLENNGELKLWYDGEILAGQDWDRLIIKEIDNADIILLLISKHFFNSEYIEKKELKMVLNKHKAGKAIVLPIIVKPCLWDVHPEIKQLQVLPKQGKPISSYSELDEAISEIAREIQKIIKLEKCRDIIQKVEEAINAFELGMYDIASTILLKYASCECPINPRGYAIMGLMCEMGKGNMKKDAVESLKWIQKSGEQGDNYGQLLLGVKYHYGNGVAVDYEKAVKWYRKAAEQENAIAQCSLGFMYENGLGVSQNYPEAEKWYLKALSQGLEIAKTNLKRLNKSK